MTEQDRMAELELAAGALAAIQRLLDSGNIPRGTFADDQVRNLVALYNQRGDEIERLRDNIAELVRQPAAGAMTGRPQDHVLVAAINRIYRAKVYEGGEMKNGISVEMIAAITAAAAAANRHPEIERLDRAVAGLEERS